MTIADAADAIGCLDSAYENVGPLLTMFDDDKPALLAWAADPNFDVLAPEHREGAWFCFGYFQGAADVLTLSVVELIREAIAIE